MTLAREAWMAASLSCGSARERTRPHSAPRCLTILGARLAHDASVEFQKVSLESLRKDMADVVANTDEAEGEISTAPEAAGGRTVVRTGENAVAGPVDFGPDRSRAGRD